MLLETRTKTNMSEVFDCARPVVSEMDKAVRHRGYTFTFTIAATIYFLGVVLRKSGARFDFDKPFREVMPDFVAGYENAHKWKRRLRH